MPDPAFLFAVLVGVSAATYSTFLKLGSGGINPALGAVIVTGAAAVVNLVVLLGMRAQGQSSAGSRPPGSTSSGSWPTARG